MPAACAPTGWPLRRRVAAARSARTTCRTRRRVPPAARARCTTTRCRRSRLAPAPRECAALACPLPEHAPLSYRTPIGCTYCVPIGRAPSLCLPLCPSLPRALRVCVRRGRAPSPRLASVGMPRAVPARPRAVLVCVCAFVRAPCAALCALSRAVLAPARRVFVCLRRLRPHAYRPRQLRVRSPPTCRLRPSSSPCYCCVREPLRRVPTTTPLQAG